MIARTFARRLERLERRVLPDDAPQTCIRIHSISPDGEVVATRVIKLSQRAAREGSRASGLTYR